MRLERNNLYRESDIDYLNEYGRLSISLIRRLHHISSDQARYILRNIVEDFENVYWLNEAQIAIEGRWGLPEAKKLKGRVRKKKAPRWKDVTQP